MLNYLKSFASLFDFTEEMNNQAFLWLFFRMIVLAFTAMLFVIPLLVVLIIDPFISVYAFTFIITSAVIIFLIRTHNVADKWYLGLILVSPTILLFVGIIAFLRIF